MLTTPTKRRLYREQLARQRAAARAVAATAVAATDATATTVVTSVVPDTTTELDGIFVSIPSYRDPQIVDTVRHCLKQAKHPERIYIGVCEQNNDKVDITCKILHKEHEFFVNHVLVDSISFLYARGPCYARERIETHLLPTVLSKVKFMLCIDAHTLFQKHWDDIILQEWYKEKNDMVFFTGYPPQYTHNKFNNSRMWRQCANNRNVFMRATKFIGNGSPLYVNNHLFNTNMSTYCIGLSAGFIFAKADMFVQVPYLKNVPYSFLGEEPAMLLRYFTHGYIPKTCAWQVIQTTYHRGGRPSFIQYMTRHQKNTIRAESNRKIRELLQGRETDIGSIGKVKTHAEFEHFMGIDFQKGVMSIRAQCGISGYDTRNDLITKFGTDNMYAIQRMFRVFGNRHRPIISF